MQCVYDNLLFAFYRTGNAAYTLVIIDHSVVINNRYRTLRTCSFTFSAGNTAVSASLANHFIIFLCGRTWNKVGGISWDHADQPLWTDVLFRAVTAAVALFSVDDDTSVNQTHRLLLTDFDAGTDADAATLAFASGKTAFYGFFAGRASREAFLSGSSSVTGDERVCVLRC